ncbi:MAG: hypothetical protein M9921_09615 [Fimbriimonadaceae bacterium]|nr:hypothetical protein [Fimbriimonadaceae bacterium]
MFVEGDVMNFQRPLLIAALALGTTSAFAAPYSWVNWTSWTNGVTASGTISTSNGLVGVTVTGGFTDLLTNYPAWTPTTSWADGSIVDNAPDNTSIVKLISPTTITVTFDRAVSDLAFAVWSVGQNGNAVTYSFDHNLSLVTGGPSTEYGGQTITTTATTLTGEEGNGTVLFAGPLTSLTFTTNPAENWHGFNLGLKTAQPVPEPFTMVLGAAALAVGANRRRAKKA